MGPLTIIPGIPDYYQGDRNPFNLKDLTGEDDDMPYWLRDQVEGVYQMHNENAVLKTDWNYVLNRPMTNYEINKRDVQSWVDQSSNFLDDLDWVYITGLKVCLKVLQELGISYSL